MDVDSVRHAKGGDSEAAAAATAAERHLIDGWMDGCGAVMESTRLAVLPSPGTTDRPTVMHHHDARRREIRRVSSAIIPSPAAAAATTTTSYY